MSWVKLDDAMPDNLKVATLSDAAFRAYVTSICYAARNLTDGFVPVKKAKEFAGRPRVVAELMPHLWEGREGGFHIHDYLAYNPTRDEVLAAKAEANAAKVAGGRARASGAQRVGGRFTSSAPAETPAGDQQKHQLEHQLPTSPVPDPDPDLVSANAETPKTRARRRELAEEDLVRFREDHPTLDVDRQAMRYRNWLQAKGNPHKDQVAGFRNWLDEEEQRASVQRHTPGRNAVSSESKIAEFGRREGLLSR